MLGMIAAVICLLFGLIGLIVLIIIGIWFVVVLKKYRLASIVAIITYLGLFIYFALTFRIGPP